MPTPEQGCARSPRPQAAGSPLIAGHGALPNRRRGRRDTLASPLGTPESVSASCQLKCLKVSHPCLIGVSEVSQGVSPRKNRGVSALSRSAKNQCLCVSQRCLSPQKCTVSLIPLINERVSGRYEKYHFEAAKRAPNSLTPSIGTTLLDNPSRAFIAGNPIRCDQTEFVPREELARAARLFFSVDQSALRAFLLPTS
jgi:hypothetical protein